MKFRRIIREYAFFLVGLVLVSILGIKHFFDTKKGAVATGEYWLIRNYQLLFIFLIAGLILIGYLMLIKKHKSIEQVFIIVSIFLGFIYSLVLPPLSAPDEVSHYISAYKLSNQMMGEKAVQEHGLVYIRSEDQFIEDIYNESGNDDVDLSILGQILNQETYMMIHDRGFWGNVDQGTVVSNQWTVRTTPLAYFPQALGITVARLLQMTGVGLLFMGRWFNLAFYVVMVYFAMKRLSFGKEVLFGVSLLPMILHLSGSMSYDVMILALSFYFTAVCIDLAFSKEMVSKRDVVLLAVIIGVLSPCKIVYAVIMGLCFLIPRTKFGSWKNYLLAATIVFASFVVGMIVVNSQTVTVYLTETESYVEWAGEAGYSFAYLLHNPGLVLQMFYETIIWQSQNYHLNLIGQSLGNMDPVLNVPYLVVIGFSISLLILSLRKPGESLKISTGQKIWIILICLIGASAILFSMLLAWTPMGAKTIEGVQGRYFLPFLPVLLFCVKNDWIVLTKAEDHKVLYGMCLANGYLLLRLFSIVSMRL